MNAPEVRERVRAILLALQERDGERAEALVATLPTPDQMALPADYVALVAFAHEAVAGVPRALEDASNLLNELVYQAGEPERPAA